MKEEKHKHSSEALVLFRKEVAYIGSQGVVILGGVHLFLNSQLCTQKHLTPRKHGLPKKMHYLARKEISLSDSMTAV